MTVDSQCMMHHLNGKGLTLTDNNSDDDDYGR